MSGLFAGLWRTGRALSHRTRVMIQQRATYVHSKPAKDTIGPVESVVALTGMSLLIIGPSCWIMAHLDHYKSRD